MAELSFFIGKGGVGKTTVSAAYAVRSAIRRRHDAVLLLSTDPAHSLADIFQQRFSDRPTKVPLPSRARLYVWQVNAEAQFRAFLDRHKAKMLSILENGSIFSREDIEPLLDTTLPGMAEMAALMAIADVLRSREYGSVVIDTAPLGHTLRLFQLPEYFSRFLDFLELAASRDAVLAAHFGGRPRSVSGRLLADWRGMVDAVQKELTQGARIFLVTTPEKFSLEESWRAIGTLRNSSPSMGISAIVLNRAVLRAGKCRICSQRKESARAARAFWKKKCPDQELFVGEDTGDPVIGAAGLAAFGENVFSGKRKSWKVPLPQSEEVRLLPAKWPVLDRSLSLVLGKGGVGKTTIAGGLAFRTRASARLAVEICSVDPAPSLDDLFQTEVGDQSRAVLGDGKLRASELDAARLFREWAAKVKEMIDEAMTSDRSAVHLDLRFEREMFERLMDSVPPGLDEIIAVLRILELVEARASRVVIDMAPAGHALELLRTPQRILVWTRLLLKTLAQHRTLALARDAGVKIAELARNVRGLADLLTNAKETRVYTVMLPETLPDRETERLMSALGNLKLSSGAIFVNRVLFEEDMGSCRRCGRARQWQLQTLRGLIGRYAGVTMYAVRNFPSEIAGKKALRSFTGELWRLA